MAFKSRESGKGIPSLLFTLGFLIYVIDASIRILSMKASSMAASTGLLIKPSYLGFFHQARLFEERLANALMNPFTLYPLLLLASITVNLFLFIKYSRNKMVSYGPPSFRDFSRVAYHYS